MLIKVSDTIYLRFNEITKTSETIDVTELEATKLEIETRLAELDDLSDSALLAWAKKNYPRIEEQREKEGLELTLTKINATLGEIYGS